MSVLMRVTRNHGRGTPEVPTAIGHKVVVMRITHGRLARSALRHASRLLSCRIGQEPGPADARIQSAGVIEVTAGPTRSSSSRSSVTSIDPVRIAVAA